ncbi:MAG: ABC transporter permease [Hyphomicrobiales bacterium]
MVFVVQDFGEAFRLAGELMVSADSGLLEIVALSLRVSLTAVAISCVIGLPIGAATAIARFPGRGVLLIVLNALMGLPPVVVGLIVYLHFSNAGPLGWMQLLYTPTAMIVAQVILIAPIIAALSRQVLEDLYEEYEEQFRSMCVPAKTAVAALIWDGRYSLLTVALAGFGRAMAEVGAVIIVGGNIDHLTRVMTTAIALETSKGDLPMALALGFVLLAIALAVNALVMGVRLTAVRNAYA